MSSKQASRIAASEPRRSSPIRRCLGAGARENRRLHAERKKAPQGTMDQEKSGVPMDGCGRTMRSTSGAQRSPARIRERLCTQGEIPAVQTQGERRALPPHRKHHGGREQAYPTSQDWQDSRQGKNGYVQGQNPPRHGQTRVRPLGRRTPCGTESRSAHAQSVRSCRQRWQESCSSRHGCDRSSP